MPAVINTPRPSQTLVSGTTSYSVQATLGEGVYGKVVKCLKEDTKEMVAVKVLKKHCIDTEQEAAMLQYLSNVDQDQNHLLKLHEKFDCRGDTCLALEMLDISLWDLICSRGCKPLGLGSIRQIAQQLLIALNALNSLGVLHMDIKPDNIMVVNRDDPQINVKLIDFGLAMRTGEVPRGTVVQPIGYRAPEIYLGQPITEAIDVWGVGCVLAYLFTGRHLYPVHCMYQNMKYLVETQGMPDPELLDTGIFTQSFFIREQGTNGSSWRFMTHKEFEWTNFHRPQMMDPTIPRLKSLADLANMYPASSVEELGDRFLFVDLLQHLLHVDWRKRITPREALAHPFFNVTYQATPDTLSLSNKEPVSLSTDKAHEVVSSSSEEEFGFWRNHAPVPGPCASQVRPDVVDEEMVKQEVVSSSSEETCGFWRNRAHVSGHCASQVRPDVVNGEMVKQEVVSSSSEEEFGFWCNRTPVPGSCASQIRPDVVNGEMVKQEVVSSSSEETCGFWRNRAPIPGPCAAQVRPDVIDGEMVKQEVVSSSTEEEFGFWCNGAPGPSPCASQVSPDVVDGGMVDYKVVSSSSEVDFGFCSTIATIPVPCSDGPLPCIPYGDTQLSGEDASGAQIITTESLDSCDEGTLSLTEDRVLSARGVDQKAPQVKAPGTLNWRKRVRRRIQKGCRWFATLFCFNPSSVQA